MNEEERQKLIKQGHQVLDQIEATLKTTFARIEAKRKGRRG